MERGFLMDLLDQMKHRRSVRSYTGQLIAEEALKKVLQAGLLSASSRSIRPWEFVVVRDRKMLQVLSECRIGSAKMLQHADCAIVVFADAEKSDVWVEDCSIAMANMHLMADALGLGSCWIHRAKEEFELPEGKELLKSLGIEDEYEGIGHCIIGYADGDAPSPAERKEHRVYSVD